MKIEICDNTQRLLGVLAICIAIATIGTGVTSCAKVYNETQRDEAKIRGEVEMARYKAGIITPGKESK